MKIRPIADWKCKYIGFKIDDMLYYVGIAHPDVRGWGYEYLYYDGPFHIFKLYYISFCKHYDF
jgi:hypothetical protein